MTDTVVAASRSVRPIAGLLAATLLVAAGLLFTGVHARGSDPNGPEGWLQHVSMGLPLVATGVIVGIGSMTRCPWLMVVGGAVALPICLVSVVGLPALLPAGVAIAIGARGLTTVTRRDWLAGLLIAAPLVVGFGYEVLHQDAADWTTPEGSAGSSNVVTTAESVLVLATVAFALLVAVYYARATASERS